MEILVPSTATEERVEALRAEGYEVVDVWSSARDELAALAALPVPPAGLAPGSVPADDAATEAMSRYIVWPWRRTVARLPVSEVFHILRTSRNRHLIPDDEQRAWSSALVGVAGLSVGASAVTACQATGARHFRVADGDVLGITNLNRIADVAFSAGLPKAELVRRRIFEIDPYASVEPFETGLDEAALDAFLGAPGSADAPLSVLVEETDDLYMKVLVRRRCRELRIPVVMSTDLGDSVTVDVERYDLDPETPVLGGRVDEFSDDDLRSRDPRIRLALMRSLLADDAPPSVMSLLEEVGRSLTSWPQLGSTAMLAGALAAYAARRIIVGRDLPSCRYVVHTDAIFT
ncbi:ThiF family adenylyltransferase [Tsukamurella sp. 8F]|uniref:ThiF family adenylyltransferase n=1 Tax=unclassified Tsukamurella TaxID=2633480 RepID=UPI0023B92CD6|nr:MULTISPECIES: ThiF family adenylyltransferase [unclassified Tsukamurella]MDF0532048.1 ThiF family adenylyltransferase [Tsukamurella sp. 8J]MDF0587521.1 ThiF family adenylyltransferase [Tsukamurella sp. 8F]